MSNDLAHFAINADDVERARSFYATVFGWTFNAFGPPGFYQIDGSGTMGALQQRRDLIEGRPIHGFECTIAVDDVGATAAAAVAAGGKVVMEATTIEGVGDLIFVEDTEGNIVGAMCYVEGRR